MASRFGIRPGFLVLTVLHVPYSLDSGVSSGYVAAELTGFQVGETFSVPKSERAMKASWFVLRTPSGSYPVFRVTSFRVRHLFQRHPVRLVTCFIVQGFTTQSTVVAQLTLLVAITVLHRSCSVAAEPLHR